MKKKYTSPFWPSPEKLELERQLSNYLIWLHMLDEGQPVDDGFVALRLVCEGFMPSLKRDSADSDDMASAINAMDEIKQRDTWKKSDLMGLVTAINIINGKPMLNQQDARRVLYIQEAFA